jgi:translation initiation factor IF-2
VRLYEVAKDLGLANKDLVAKVRALGIEVKNHMSNLDAEDVARVKRALDKERQANLVEERLTSTVIRRRSRDGAPIRPAVAAGSTPAEVTERRAAEPVRVEAREPMREPAREAREARPPVVVREAREPAREVEVRDVREAREAREARPEPLESTSPAATAPTPEPRPEPRRRTVVLPSNVSAATPAAGGRGQAPQIEIRRPAQATTEATASTKAAEKAERPERPERPEQPSKPEVAPVEPKRVEAPAATAEPTTVPAEAQAKTEATEQAAAQAKVESVEKIEVTTPKAPVPVPPPTVTPPAKEEVRLGPTGRVIELPLPRIEIRQADPRGISRDPRGALAAKGPQPYTGGPTGRDRFGGRRDQRGGKKMQMPAGKKGKQTQITTPAAHKRVIKMDETIAVAEIAKQMGVKAPDVLKKLWSMGMTGIMLNNAIDLDTATLLASEFGFDVESTAFQESEVIAATEDRPEDLAPRAPVVTIMGHVDHGKTSLLDAIRDANVAAGEAGGITQHIGAYKITTEEGNDVVFLDTPGHEAFTAMRARGAQVTDIVILVVAADDGVMPTTIEALNHAKQAGVTIIVAVNKIDKPGAQPDRIRQQLSDHGLIPEQWGGDTIFVDVSARTKQGIDQLLQMIALQAEVLELKANPNKAAKGTIVEAKLDRNRGPMATVLVQEGTLRVGDVVVAGEHSGKVRAMLDDKGRNVSEAGPSTPVELLGLSGVPDAGEQLNAVADEKQVKELIEHRRDARRRKELAGSSRVTLENILERIKEGAVKELKVVLKADVQGSSEALKASLTGLSTEQVKVDVISSGVGGITESDVNLAKAGNAIIVGFHVRPAGKAQQLAEQEGVDIKLYDIIYEALDDVKKAMAGLLAPVRREKYLGKAEIRQTFNIPKVGTIAGCFVLDGTIKRSAQVRLVRDSVAIFTGKLASLRRFKDDVREVVGGYECGMNLEGYNDIKVGDVIEAFEIEEVAPTL